MKPKEKLVISRPLYMAAIDGLPASYSLNRGDIVDMATNCAVYNLGAKQAEVRAWCFAENKCTIRVRPIVNGKPLKTLVWVEIDEILPPKPVDTEVKTT